MIESVESSDILLGRLHIPKGVPHESVALWFLQSMCTRAVQTRVVETQFKKPRFLGFLKT